MSGIIAQNSGRHTGLVKASSAGGTWNLIETLTASSSATLDFTSGIDDTYDEYIFRFISMHPATDGVQLTVNFTIDGGSNWNVTKTTTYFLTRNDEDDGGNELSYKSTLDLAQSTAHQMLDVDTSNDADHANSGYLHLFNPSSTVFVKHFISVSNNTQTGDSAMTHYVAGYGNTTSAIDGVQFKFNSGNIDAGTISLYGIS